MSTLNQINKTLIDQQLQREFEKSKALKQSTFSHIDNDEYSIMNHAPASQLMLFQFLASFLFVYGNLCSTSIYESDAQAEGVFFMAICFSGSLCGANINPVITIANYFKKQGKYKSKLLACYLIAQFLGAFAGLLWSDVLGHELFNKLVIDGVGDVFKVMANEATGVFIFVSFTLLLSNPNTTFIQNELSGYISIAIFYYIARSFAPFAGLLINPAVTLSVSVHYSILGKWESLSNCWVWILGDLIGCLAAVLFYNRIYEPIIRQIRQLKRKSQNFQSLVDDSNASNQQEE